MQILSQSDSSQTRILEVQYVIRFRPDVDPIQRVLRKPECHSHLISTVAKLLNPKARALHRPCFTEPA